MNEAKVRAVIDSVYNLAHDLLVDGHHPDAWDMERALLKIRDDIETLDDDDLGIA